MAATATRTSGPTFIGPGQKLATYTVLLDSAHASGGEAIDLTADFDYVFAAWAAGNDTAVDNSVKFDFVVPGATALSASNLLITAYWSADGTDGEQFVENTGDLSGVGALSIVVLGK